jgi:hypothetical protein
MEMTRKYGRRFGKPYQEKKETLSVRSVDTLSVGEEEQKESKDRAKEILRMAKNRQKEELERMERA